MAFQTFSLHQLGWRPAYAQPLNLADFEAGYPARVMAVDNDCVALLSSRGRIEARTEGKSPVPGDWVMISQADGRVMRVLPRHSVLPTAGDHDARRCVANVDAVFIVSPCDARFRLSELRSHLALARDGHATPVIVLLGAHASIDVGFFVAAAQSLSPTVTVVALDAGNAGSLSQLSLWLQPGKTVAVAGADQGRLIGAIASEAQRTVADAMQLRHSAWGGWLVALGEAGTPDAIQCHSPRMRSAAVVELSFDLAS